ncbi:50S ribosomal protein L20 [Ktedonobacteria bacterium brp13]|jgi:large subunit ribosomal protein L20|nr:50S ribosomal protein L20 [Ktedonobacteria bacterium brp13]
MPRVKRGVTAHKKHKKVLQFAEGHRGTRRRLFRPAHESVMRSMAYMYRDRRSRKRDMRRLWITRINAAARMHGISYSQLMHAIHVANIEVDRKILAEMAVNDMPAFSTLVKTALDAAHLDTTTANA